jgi:hypothetical protein
MSRLCAVRCGRVGRAALGRMRTLFPAVLFEDGEEEWE